MSGDEPPVKGMQRTHTAFMLRVHDLPRRRQLLPLGDTEEEARRMLAEFTPEEVDALLRGERVRARSHSDVTFSIVRWEKPAVRLAKVVGYLAAVGIIVALRWETILVLLSDPDVDLLAVLVVVLGAPIIAYQLARALVGFVRKAAVTRMRR